MKFKTEKINLKQMTKKNKNELISRVQSAKAQLIALNLTRSDFFDEHYGAMLDKEHMRIENLWNTKSTDMGFTIDLENYVFVKSNKS